ncbi:MAG: long-chain fatty acid--CoA ligase [Methylobacteriaceae bacterium]|nr:long-chain fatty acid--CoA ligase [Methylobacteriaceae bacterium]
MNTPEITLRGFLAQAGDLSAGMLHGPKRSLSLDVAAHCTGFKNREDFRGRSILIATEGQLAAALVLIELDGIARRMVLCPPGLADEHLRGIVGQAEVDTIVSGEADVARYSGSVPHVVSYLEPSGPMSPIPGAVRETEWILTTSGTTGAPKLVVHTLRGLVGAIAPIVPAARPTAWATFYDIRRYGGLQIFLRAIVGGSSMILSHADEPLDQHLRRLARCGVTHISGTPSHWRRVLMSPKRDLIAPDYVRLSGEIADQAVLDALKKAFAPASVSHAYASTEAGVAFNVTDGLEGFPVNLVSQSRGRDVEMKVVDDSLCIRSARMASGYLGVPDRLHEPDGFVDTGDMVEQRGERYYFIGRRGGIINVGGLKVHPEEVERIINAHPLVRMSRVSARKNPITGALVQAEIVLNSGGRNVDDAIADEVSALCRAELAPHKVPARIKIVDHLAVTSGGKLARPNG